MHIAQTTSPARGGKAKRAASIRKSGTAQGQRKPYATAGGLIDPYRDDSNMYDSPTRGMSYKDHYIEMMGRSASRVEARQRVAERRVKAVEDREAAMAAAAKKLEKREKEKAKKQKDRIAEQAFNFEKAAETRQKTFDAKKGIDKEHKMKMLDLGHKLEERLGGYGLKEIRDAMLPPKLKAKQ